MIHLKFVNVHVLFPVWCYGIKPTLNNIFIEFYNIITRGKQESKKSRYSNIKGKSVVRRQWKDAFHWDQSHFSLLLQEKLTLSHIELDPATRMRNHLGADVLDKKKCFSWCRLGLLRYFIGHWFPTSELFTDQCFFFFLLPISWNKATVKILVINAIYFQPHISFPRIVS